VRAKECVNSIVDDQLKFLGVNRLRGAKKHRAVAGDPQEHSRELLR